jgi:hypothetical protein
MSKERPIGHVPKIVLFTLAMTLSMQTMLRWNLSPSHAHAESLTYPPSAKVLRAISMDEPIALAQLMTLYLQAFDNQPGVSIPFRELDYERVEAWLSAILELDPQSGYPLLMASHLYTQVPDEQKIKTMLSFVYEKFAEDPERRWRWLAHAAIIAKHRLKDLPLALTYATAITAKARSAPAWARQMHIVLLEDLGEVEAAKILLGGLLESGKATDPHEFHFLSEWLKRLEGGEKSPPSTNN